MRAVDPNLSPPEQVCAWISDLVPEGTAPSVLDIGCCATSAYVTGLAALSSRYVAFDAHQPYLDKLAAWTRDGKPVEKVCGKAPLDLLQFPKRTFDLVLMIDVLEHLTREEALVTLATAERLGQAVAVFTTLGHIPQDTDFYAMGGEHWQTHRSGWQVTDFVVRGYQAMSLPGFHSQLPAPNNGAIWAQRVRRVKT